jgi:hypothetical protein
MSDENETAKTAAKDTVQRKIGRNLLLYQQIEGHLKFVLANARASGTLNELAQFREDRSRKITKQMLGLLVEQFLDDILSDEAESSAEPKQLDKPWISFSFRLQVDQEARELHRKNWELVVEQRNHLVHHFLDRIAPNTLEAFLEADAFLEEQYQKALPTFNVLSDFSRALQETMRDLSAFLGSEEGKEQFRSLLSAHRTIETLLKDVASQRARADGWTYLAQLGEELKKNNVDLLLDLKKRHGSLTLKALLAAENLVDIKDEQLIDGKFRSLYKVREKPH